MFHGSLSSALVLCAAVTLASCGPLLNERSASTSCSQTKCLSELAATEFSSVLNLICNPQVAANLLAVGSISTKLRSCIAATPALNSACSCLLATTATTTVKVSSTAVKTTSTSTKVTSTSTKLTSASTSLLSTTSTTSKTSTTGTSTSSTIPVTTSAVPTGSFDCTGVKAISPKCNSNETAYLRDFYYVGGTNYVSAFGNVTVNQMYVEKLTPSAGVTQAKPLIFIHGGGPSGATWLNTPDGREGWATYFIKKGYQVYIVDINTVGRSTDNNEAIYEMLTGGSVGTVEEFFTAPEDFLVYPQAINHTQWPGTGLAGDPIFDNFMPTLIPLAYEFEAQELIARKALCELLELVGPSSYIISHSLGGKYPILAANDCPQYVAATINLEPAITPFWSYGIGLGGTSSNFWGFTDSYVDYDPPISDPSELTLVSVGNETIAHRNCYQQATNGTIHTLPNVASVPYVLLTTQASIHTTYDFCTVAYLKQVGASPEHIQLEDIGIFGNGHFMYMELNNLAIADVVDEWIVKQEAA